MEKDNFLQEVVQQQHESSMRMLDLLGNYIDFVMLIGLQQEFDMFLAAKANISR